MKTEPTESLSIKRANIVDKYLPPIDQQRYYQRLEMHEKLIDLINSHYPKIKQLEWKKSPFFNGNYEAKFGLGKYFIDDCGGCITLVCPDHSLKNKFSTIDEAKAAAQKDFEERVEKCIAK